MENTATYEQMPMFQGAEHFAGFCDVKTGRKKIR